MICFDVDFKLASTCGILIAKDEKFNLFPLTPGLFPPQTDRRIRSSIGRLFPGGMR